MRKRINLFLYNKWKWAYNKVLQARIWFYGFQEDYGRKYDAIQEPSNFAARKPKEEPREQPHDAHDFVGYEEVFHRD